MEKREWIIERCTQKWIHEERSVFGRRVSIPVQLIYEDWAIDRPQGTPMPNLLTADEMLLTRDEMIAALDEAARVWPEHEFRGHNVAHCRCERHAHLKLSIGSPAN
ncbi:MAG TPA: hypothetical protein VHA14_17255 [Bryobacteraceae bacterium]|nr:hypothetical protein [Bryobacteraceae bacterium]